MVVGEVSSDNFASAEASRGNVIANSGNVSGTLSGHRYSTAQ
jgi:hypothetical protein